MYGQVLRIVPSAKELTLAAFHTLMRAWNVSLSSQIIIYSAENLVNHRFWETDRL